MSLSRKGSDESEKLSLLAAKLFDGRFQYLNGRGF
jgi:hypothetical protein